MAPLPRGTRNRAACPLRRGPRGISSRQCGARSHCGPRPTPMRMRPTGTAQAACEILYLLQAQSVISFSRARAQQADGDETYFIMQSGRIANLRKVEIVLSRQVSSTVVALSGIHE